MKNYLLIGIILIITILIGYGITHLKSNKEIKSMNNVSTIAKSNMPENNKPIINEQTNGGNTFYFGMSRQDTYTKLKELNVPIMEEIEITNDYNAWDYGNKEIWTERFSFTFDKEGKLYEIGHITIPTTRGLKIGDSLKDMEKLYGKKYRIFDTGNDTVYEYYIKDHYFRVYILKVKNGKIEMWGISKYQFDKK